MFQEINEIMEWGDKVYLNKGLLKITVVSYFDDIVRYREYHGTKNADGHKKAAFTVKWISKIRPVNIRVDEENLTRKEILCNQVFAVIAGLSFLDIDVTKISENLFDNLLYTSQYRDIDPIQMATSMYILEKSMNKRTA